jgi:UDP-glucose 4-epimerase
MRYKKALVTGGAGFIGSHLSRALLERGVHVVVIDDLSTGKRGNVPQDAEFIEGDIGDVDLLERHVPSTDIIFHLAARVSIRSSVAEFYRDAEINVMGTLNLLRACRNTDVERIIYASSMAVYADSPNALPITETFGAEPLSPYGIAKLASEKYCLNITRELGMNCVALRYFNTYGRGQSFTPYVGVITIFIRQLLAGERPTIFGSGEQRRDFVHVGDVVDATLAAMEYGGPSDIFNVGSGTGMSVNELASLLCSRINPALTPRHTTEHPGEIQHSVADISKAGRLLHYEPRGRCEGLLDDIIEWNRSQMTS